MSLITKYDILLFQETKTDKYDKLDLPCGYDFKAKHRKKIDRKSGGIVIIYKKLLCNFIEFLDSDSDFVQWLKLKNNGTKISKDILIGCTYIPPEHTKYASDESISEIESEMFNFAKNGECICILGDFNAKTGNLPDFVQPDESLLDIFDLYDDPDLITYMYDYENLLRVNFPLHRKSTCSSRPNSYGNKLLDFCRKNNIYIMNGRAGKDGLLGERTCKDSTVIDYCLCSSNLLSYISDFEIMEFSPMFSDVHKQLHLTLDCFRATVKTTGEDSTKVTSNTRAKRWNSDKCDSFANQLVADNMFAELNFMIGDLDNLEDTNIEIDCENINSIVDKIGTLFDKIAKDAFGTIQPKRVLNHQSVNKPWFDLTCKEKRRQYHEARKVYNRFKNEVNRTRLSVASRNYKLALDSSFKSIKIKLQMISGIRRNLIKNDFGVY